MPEPVLHRRVLAVVVLVAAARTWMSQLDPPPADLLRLPAGPPTLLPDPARADWVQLTWLPGLGTERARQIVALRPHLGVPLNADRFGLLPGIGPGLAAQIRAWYAEGGRSPRSMALH